MGHNYKRDDVVTENGDMSQVGEITKEVHHADKPLIYLRSSVSEDFAAELCFRGDDGIFHSYEVSPRALANMLNTGTSCMAEHANRQDRE
jgi:hypothetical protein